MSSVFSRVRYGVAALIGLAGLAIWALPALAQGVGTVRGRVAEAVSGAPVEAANLFVQGSDFGALSQSDGQFELVLPAGAHTVSVRRVGFRAQSRQVTVTAGGVTELNFALAQTVVQLEEVVVTGAGAAVEKKKLGNTIATISAEALEDQPVRSLSEMLSAREPSVVLNANSGLAGEGASIRIRGSSSLSQSNEPIVYVDGIRVDRGGGFANPFSFVGGGGAPSRIDDINPDAIDRIEVLKGAAAATLYGTEASNGVIQIFTKRGQRGSPRFDFTVEQGWSTMNTDRYKPNTGFARSQTQADSLNTFYGRSDIQPFRVFENNFSDRLFGTGYSSSYSASLSGGTSAITYFLNGRYQHDNGPFTVDNLGIEEDFTLAEDVNRRIQGTAAIEIFAADNVKVRATAGYTDQHHETPQNNNNIYGVLSSAVGAKPERARCASAAGNSTPNGDGTCSGLGNWSGTSFATIREVATASAYQDVQHYLGSLQLTYSPTSEVSLDGTVGVDANTSFSAEFFPFGWGIDGSNVFDAQGIRGIAERNRREITVEGKATWNKNFTDWSSTLIGGVQGFGAKTVISSGLGAAFPGPGLEVTGAAADPLTDERFLEVINAGAFAQEQLGYRDLVFLTVGGRWDRNSAFGEEATSVFYPKASISFIPSALDGWAASGTRAKYASTLRLRAAVGQSGLQPGAFDKFTTFGSLPSEELGPGLAPDNLGNQSLKPEKATQWEAGLEWALLDDQLAFDFTWWRRITRDALFTRQFAPSGGFQQSQLVNIGELFGRGIELSGRWLAVNRPNTSLEVFANASFLKEVVSDLGGAPPIKVGGAYIRYRNWLIEGYAPSSFFGAALLPTAPGVYAIDTNADGQPDSEAEALAYFANPVAAGFDEAAIQPLLRTGNNCSPDADGNPLSNLGALCTFLGKPTPDWQGSFGFNLGFIRNFRLNSVFEWKAGNYFVHNLTDAFRSTHPNIGRNFETATQAEATLVNPASSAEQRLAAWQVYSGELMHLAPRSGLNAVEKADFMRWRELALTYDLPSEWVRSRFGVRNASLTLGVRNLALWTGYSGIDPEANFLGRFGDPGSVGNTIDNNFGQSIDGWGFALPRRVTFRLNVGF